MIGAQDSRLNGTIIKDVRKGFVGGLHWFLSEKLHVHFDFVCRILVPVLIFSSV